MCLAFSKAFLNELKIIYIPCPKEVNLNVKLLDFLFNIKFPLKALVSLVASTQNWREPLFANLIPTNITKGCDPTFYFSWGCWVNEVTTNWACG